MAEGGGTLREFLVRLGFEVDKDGHERFTDALEKAQLKAELLADVLKELAKKSYESFMHMGEDAAKLGFIAQQTGTSVEVIEAFAYRMQQSSGMAHEAAIAAITGMAQKLQSTPGLGQRMKEWAGSAIEGGKVTQEHMEHLSETFKKLIDQDNEASAFAIGEMVNLSHETVHTMGTVKDIYTEEHEKKVHAVHLHEKEFAEDAIAFSRALTSLTTTVELLFKSVAASITKDGGEGLAGFVKYLDKNAEHIAKGIASIANALLKLGHVIAEGVVYYKGLDIDKFTLAMAAFVLVLITGSMAFGTTIGVVTAFGFLIAQFELFDKAHLPEWLKHYLQLAVKFLGVGGAEAAEAKGGDEGDAATQPNIGNRSLSDGAKQVDVGGGGGMLSRAWNKVKSAFGYGGSEHEGNRSSGGMRSRPGAAPGSVGHAHDMKVSDHYPEGLAGAIKQSAKDLGVKPEDIATAISYETAGTFDPWKRGPTTKWGQHRGLIQCGEPQRQKYGVYEGMPVAEQMKAVTRYLHDAGVRPGMSMVDIYSAINAGSVGRNNASDAGAGGAPGTVADKVNYQMAAHRRKAAALLGSDNPTADSLSIDKSGSSLPTGREDRPAYPHGWGRNAGVKSDYGGISTSSVQNNSMTNNSWYNSRPLGAEGSHDKEVNAGTENHVNQQIHINGNTVAKAPTTGKPSDDVQEHKDARTLSNLTGAGVQA
jgi:hypothetical protein